jgi:dienelactone hydrolase
MDRDSGRLELYRLDRDPGEKEDLATRFPAEASRLRALLDRQSVLDRGPYFADGSGTVNDQIAQAMERAEISMLFRGETEAEFRAWRQRFRARLLDLLGETSPPAAWQVEETGRADVDGFTRHDLLLRAEGVPSLPIYLLVPPAATATSPAPAVLCVHGHGPYGHDAVAGRSDLEGVAENIAELNYDYGAEFARRGYVVAAPCMIPFGRRVERSAYRGQDPCAVTFVRLEALGRLPMAENLRDLRWSIDFLESRPEVRRERIGCAGLSYGGRMTMLVSALDERIRVAAISGALNLQQERLASRHRCGAQIIPGLLRYGDYAEIASLIAPRPCVWEVGSEDPLIVPGWDGVFRRRLERAYRALGASAELRFDHFEGGHRWNGKVAYGLFDEVLEK